MKLVTIILGWLFACLFGQAGCSCSNQNSKDLISMPKNPEADAAHVKGADVLRESEKAYAALSSYKGTITIASTSQYANFAHKSSRQFKVFFQRPGRIRLEGRDSNGDPILIISDGKNVVDRSEPDPKVETDVAEILYANAGVSLRATETLPGILLEIKWSRQMLFLPRGKFLAAFASKAKLEGTTAVDGHKCHRVVCEREIQTWTFYIDTESHLIRQIDETASIKQKQAQKRHGGGGVSGKIQSTTLTQTFKIQEVNKDLDSSLFKIPKK